MKKKSFVHQLFDDIKSIFLNGLFTLLPITLTFLLFKASFKLIGNWIEPIHRLQPQCLQKLPYSDYIFVILFIFIIGIILKFFILKKLIHSIEETIFYKIPILKTVYSGIKQLVHAITQQDQMSFNKVVITEFPNKGIYSLGFLTSEFPKKVFSVDGVGYYSVFIPTTPNPTTGFFVLVRKEEIIEVDLTKQEAMSIIISGGIIKPERFRNI